jgi:hypothetical protein
MTNIASNVKKIYGGGDTDSGRAGFGDVINESIK